MSNDDQVWYKPKEFGELFDPPISYSTVLRWIRNGQVAAINMSLVSPHYVIPHSEYERVRKILYGVGEEAQL